MKPIDYTLYVITDRAWLRGVPLADAVAQAIEGGASLVQIREKHVPTEEYILRAREIKAVCDRYGVPLIVNDSVEVAQAAGAGVHLGADDGDIAEARRILGPDAVIGATAKTIAQAQAAERAGADYLGAGAVFGSTTKADAKPMAIAQFLEICKSVSIPVVAIGGVSADNALQLTGAGAAGLCVISAVFAQPDIQAAARRMRALAEEVCQ